VEPNIKGYLIIRKPWPGMLLTLWGDDEKYKNVYWSKFQNNYYSGDYAIKDSDGYFWLLGRADDILKVAGHRIGTAELESSLVSHHNIAEAAVCGIPDEIKGEVIVAFVVLTQDAKSDTDSLRTELVEIVRNGIGPIATPHEIYFVTKLPKTRSGKIMRRVLKAIAGNEKVGDISTLEDSAVVKDVQDVFTELQGVVRKNKH
jgi:acetyl-CoA synthetase